MKKIYLIDVSSLFFRAFYAIRHLNNKKGLPTNALYGFLAALTKLLKEHKPDGLVFCYDRPESGFREEIYSDYKANRDEAPDDLVKQIPYIAKIAEALNIAAFDKAGFEADDIIGTLCKKAKGHGIEVIIVSGDKDFAQLVEPGVRLFDPSKDLYTDSDGVRAKFGVNPVQIIDYLALVGDAVDNVPGVDGIGPKGAQKLLNEFESLDGIYANIDKVKNDKLREKLKAQKDQAYLSQKLVTIHCDMDLNLEPEDLKVKPLRRELLVPLLEELEFRSLLQRLVGGDTAAAEPATKRTAASAMGMTSPSFDGTDKNRDTAGAVEVENFSSPSGISVAVEFETKTSHSISDAKILTMTLEKSVTREVWLDVTNQGIALQIDDQLFRYGGSSEALKNWIETSPVHVFSGYDVKTALRELKIAPSAFKGIGTDVLLQGYCLGQTSDLALSDLSEQKLGRSLPEFLLPEDRLSIIKQLARKLHDDLEAMKSNENAPGFSGPLKVLTEIEQPLSPVLYQMEHAGIQIDSERLQKFSQNLLQDLQRLEKEICAAAGYEFNIGSPKQLAQVLFEKLKLPVVRKTKTGYSTDSDVLEKLEKHHPLPAKILEWREIAKLKSTYVDALPRLVDPFTGRVHTHYNQAVAATGRLSSSNPNLQNIPIRTEKGQQIRESFIAPPGFSLISADYSQVELRILAHLTDDPGLKRAFSDEVDIHTATASEVFGVKLNEVTADHRRAAKAINFGIAYGMSDFGLAESLNITREEASTFISKYFSRFSGVRDYIRDIIEEGKKHSYVETMFGRRRYYPGIKSSNGRIRQMAERAVINMPIQGAAADIIKLAMISIAQKLNGDGFGESCMLLQVHDELVFQVKAERALELKEKVKIWMESAVELKVPLKVSIGVGSHWGDAH